MVKMDTQTSIRFGFDPVFDFRTLKLLMKEAQQPDETLNALVVDLLKTLELAVTTNLFIEEQLFE
tara:strand:- start:14423 stop:14617 length:195 start_codon:yes stop_codon:yes gene_type:complete